jgi:hypothetical protein
MLAAYNRRLISGDLARVDDHVHHRPLITWKGNAPRSAPTKATSFEEPDGNGLASALSPRQARNRGAAFARGRSDEEVREPARLPGRWLLLRECGQFQDLSFQPRLARAVSL